MPNPKYRHPIIVSKITHSRLLTRKQDEKESMDSVIKRLLDFEPSKRKSKDYMKEIPWECSWD